MPNETGEIRHQLLNNLEAHALYVGVIAFVVVLGIIMTVGVVAEIRAKRIQRDVDARIDRARAAARDAGIEEGFRRGWHG